jgi:spermidine synthase
MTLGRRSFLVVYMLSGAAGLVYEVTWTRLLTLQLGHTVAAASTVLAAFMGGLAVGAWLAGGYVDRSRGFRTYAFLEIAIAVAAILLPIGLKAAFPVLAWAYADGEAPARFAFVRVAISLLLVGIPAAAMGATFPVAIAASRNTAPAALYAANTTGAAVGAIAAGFWLIPTLGLRGTTWVGVTLNLVAAAGAFAIAQTATGEPINAESAKDAKKRQPKESLRTSRTLRFSVSGSPSPSVARTAAAISGFSALVYEVVWTRLLALVIGPTTYAFATMAASFISGLAIGSAIGARLASRTDRPGPWLGALMAIGAVAAIAAAWYAGTAMPLAVAAQVADPDVSFDAVVWRQALGVALLLLPMTLVLGASFPLALALAGGEPATAARDASRVYAANTIGAITGSLAAGFLLVPMLGLRDSIRIAALLAAAAGVAVLFTAGEGNRGRLVAPIAATALAIVAIVFMPPWDRALLASGAYKYAPYLSGTDLDGVLRAGQIVYYREGATGTVSVRDLTGTRSLAIDGKVDASNAGDMLTQRLLGLLPVLLHGHAEDVAIIGLGSGVTVGSALAPGTAKRTDVLEISPEVVDASHFFDKENGGALSQPGVRLIVGDGRSHLLLSPRQYDVIVSEPSNPWMAGVASLFTREFFAAARSRLKPDGILCQWAHTYDIATADLRSIIRTFASVFPEGSLWLVGGGDLLLIGTKSEAGGPGGSSSIDGRLEQLARAPHTAVLADVGVTDGAAVPFTLLTLFAGGPRELAAFGDDAVLQTDDRTPLEYSAPRGIYGRTREDNAATIRALKPAMPPALAKAIGSATDRDWTSRGYMDLRAQAFPSAYDAFREAISRNSRNSQALAGLSDAAGGCGKLNEARDWLREIAAREPNNSPVRIELSRLLAVTGDGKAAAEMAAAALELAPDDPRAAEQLASVLADEGDAERLASFADAMVGRFPDRVDGQYYRASAMFMRGKTEEAVATIRGVVATHPDHARGQGLLGAACAALGLRECAQTAFDLAIAANPRDPSAYINAGAFRLRTADAQRAADYFASALAIDPSSTTARTGLMQARAQLASR